MEQTRIQFKLGVNLSSALGLIVLGALLLRDGIGILDTLIFIMAVVLVAIGIVGVVNFVRSRARKVQPLLVALALIALGVLLYFFGGQILTYILIVVGAFLVVYGIIDLMSLLKRKTKNHTFFLVLTLIKIAIGVLLIIATWLTMGWFIT
ncbi:MAG: hypothetical protein EOM77_05180, partial [Bacteroidia bacterium]|nr:hypothetical protein [Bacteroidia bacterium]